MDSPANINFIAGDIFEYLYDNRTTQVDTILCLGIYYHIMDHYHLLRLMAKLNPKTIIIDSGFLRSFRNCTLVSTENPQQHKNAIAAYEGQTEEVYAQVSLGLMIQMAWNCGYRVTPMIWNKSDVNDINSVRDYIVGRRFTLRLEKTSPISARENWKEAWLPALTALNPNFGGLLDRETHDRFVDQRVKVHDSLGEFTVL